MDDQISLLAETVTEAKSITYYGSVNGRSAVITFNDDEIKLVVTGKKVVIVSYYKVELWLHDFAMWGMKYKNRKGDDVTVCFVPDPPTTSMDLQKTIKMFINDIVDREK